MYDITKLFEYGSENIAVKKEEDRLVSTEVVIKNWSTGVLQKIITVLYYSFEYISGSYILSLIDIWCIRVG